MDEQKNSEGNQNNDTINGFNDNKENINKKRANNLAAWMIASFALIAAISTVVGGLLSTRIPGTINMPRFLQGRTADTEEM
ncbi:MAG TPA: hypothetical protein PLZ84_06835, partial [Clostridia bacterium]|nr:hypothetical protein [Clostridia bacterium]